MFYCDVSFVFYTKRVFEDVRKGLSIVQERVRMHPSVHGRYDLLQVQSFPDGRNENCVCSRNVLHTPFSLGCFTGTSFI